MDDLVIWLREQLDVDEAQADAILSPPPGHYDKGWQADELRNFAMRLLAEVESKRRIIDHCAQASRITAETVMRLLAEVYADRPGYRDEWRP